MGERHWHSRFATFAHVTRDYEEAARLFNVYVKTSGQEHDWRLKCVPERIETIAADPEAQARVQQAIDILRDMAGELEAGLRLRLPAGFRPSTGERT